MTLPPDRGRLETERRNPASLDLHRLDVAGCVALINEADAQVIDALRAARPALIAFIQAALPGFAAGGRLVYVGAGTSGRLGVLDASEAPPTFDCEPDRIIGLIAGGDAALRCSSEGKEDDFAGAEPELAVLRLEARDTVLGIASGGTTPYVLGALASAKRLPRPPVTGLLTSVPMRPPLGCDHCIVLSTGPEILTGSTRMKAGTATKLALNTISTTLMVQIGKVYQNLMVDLRATNAKLRDRAARIVAALTGLDRPACFALLERAGGAVTTALVMQALDLDRAAAEGRLAACQGRLDRVLDDDNKKY